MPRKKQCPKCSSTNLLDSQTTLSRQLAGVLYKIALPALVCQECSEARLLESVVDDYERVLAQQVSQGPTGGDAMKFLRKWSGVTAVELATLLDTTPETISRWENDIHPVSQAVFTLVAQIAQDKLAGHSHTLDGLKRYQNIRQAPPQLVELTIVPNATSTVAQTTRAS